MSAMADVTLVRRRVRQRSELTCSQGANCDATDINSNADGRFRVLPEWQVRGSLEGDRLSADTREGPIDDLFSQLHGQGRRGSAVPAAIDPDYSLPDLTATTVLSRNWRRRMGKFFVKRCQPGQLRPVGQLQDRLYEQRTGAGRPRPVRRKCSLPVRRHDHQFR